MQWWRDSFWNIVSSVGKKGERIVSENVVCYLWKPSLLERKSVLTTKGIKEGLLGSLVCSIRNSPHLEFPKS